MYTGTLGRAGNGAHIAYIGNTVQYQYERRLSFFKYCWDDVFYLLINNRRNNGNHSLVILLGDSI